MKRDLNKPVAKPAEKPKPKAEKPKATSLFLPTNSVVTESAVCF